MGGGRAGTGHGFYTRRNSIQDLLIMPGQMLLMIGTGDKLPECSAATNDKTPASVLAPYWGRGTHGN